MKSGSENTSSRMAVGTKVETRPAWLVNGIADRRNEVTPSDRAPITGSAPSKKGETRSTPTIEPTYPRAVPTPESLPSSFGGKSSNIIAL